MGKVGNKELAHVLIETYGLTRSAAEQFVSEMFQVLMAGLRDDKQVKIKALGTFKVTSVAARRSIDINTGDPIVIEGRDKISFVPDVSLRDEVNRPFSQFETVVLNDEVDFTEIDRKFAEDSDAFVSEVLQANEVIISDDEAVVEPQYEEMVSNLSEKRKEESVVTINEAQESSLPSIVQSEKEDNTAPAITSESVAVADVEDSSKNNGAEGLTSEAEAVTIEKAEAKPATEARSTSVNTSCENDNISEADNSEPGDSTLAADVNRQRFAVRALIVVAVVMLLAFFGGIYYFLGELQQRDNRIKHLEAQMMQSAKPHVAHRVTKSRPVDSTTIKMAHLEATVDKAQKGLRQSQEASARQLAEKERNQQPVTSLHDRTVPKAKETQAKPQTTVRDLEYNRDARVRTGAYRIIGVDKTVTLRKGQTLESVSRSYLGAGMECYVEAVNGGKTEFKAGDKLNIPKLELKKKRHNKR